MNINRSLECVKNIFQQNPIAGRPDSHIINFLEIAMRGNDFEFNGNFYLQIMGKAMGKRFAPALANLYLLNLDEKAKNWFRIKPSLFFRFLDDIFFLWPGDVKSLKEYENFLNSLITDIKVTLEYRPNTKEINFLDSILYISQKIN